VPFPQELALKLSAAVKQYVGETVVTDEVGRRFSPWDLQDAFRTARKEVNGLPEGFRFHDLRHYFASLLISSGANVKVVQKRLRHASAMTTMNLWPPVAGRRRVRTCCRSGGNGSAGGLAR